VTDGLEPGIAPAHAAVQRDPSRFRPQLEHRRRVAAVFALVCLAATLVGIVVLAMLVSSVLMSCAISLVVLI
jgi:hypothetical protein